MFPFYSSYRLPSLTSELLLIPFCALVLFWRVWPLICVSPLGVFHCCYRPISYRRLDYGVVRDQTKYTVIESVQRHYNTIPSPAHCCSRMSSEYKSTLHFSFIQSSQWRIDVCTTARSTSPSAVNGPLSRLFSYYHKHQKILCNDNIPQKLWREQRTSRILLLAQTFQQFTEFPILSRLK